MPAAKKTDTERARAREYELESTLLRSAIEKFFRKYRLGAPALPRLPLKGASRCAEWWLGPPPKRAPTLGGDTLCGALAHELAAAASMAVKSRATAPITDFDTVQKLLNALHVFGLAYPTRTYPTRTYPTRGLPDARSVSTPAWRRSHRSTRRTRSTSQRMAKRRSTPCRWRLRESP